MTSSVLRRASVAFPPLAIVLSISAAFSPLSFAQTASDQSLEPVVVTASRTVQKASDVLADNIVITAEEIQQSGQTSLIDLLQKKRGVEITRNGGAGNSSSVFLRGSNSKQVVLLIDGVRSVSSTLGDATWSAIPLSQIDRVEIVFGPMSSMYGADAVGGVIQVFTKKGSGAPRISFSAGTGTYGEQVVSAGVSGSVEGEHRIRYALNTAHEQADGFSSRVDAGQNPDKDGYRKRSMSGQFSWELAHGHELGLAFLNSRNNAEYDNGLSTYNAHNIADVDVYSLYSRNQLTENWSSFLQLSRSYNEDRSYTSALRSGLARSDSKQDQISWQNDFQLGTDIFQLLVERREENVSSTEMALNRGRAVNSVAMAYQLNHGAHIGSASVRYDNSSAYGSNVTGSIGYGYHLSKELRVSGSVGTSFRAPTYNELYRVDYGSLDNKPEKGKNAEVGLYYDDGKSDFTIAYYHNQITDLLTNKTCTKGSGTCAYNVNKALLEGISIGAGNTLGDFRLFGTLDLQDPRDKTTNKLLNRRAKYHGAVGVEYAKGPVSSGVSLAFSGYRYDDAANKNKLGGYALLNLQVGYDLNNDWQLFARWNNALDKKYEVARNYQTAGSNVFVGVRYGFK
ncbi:putative vitamin B12 transporter btuB precursor (Cobalamin receptor) (Outer membrane cobalamin translocator) BtuB-like [Herminiimonas arsenicoxydans]|uniref:Vitamin B12 transporter btuB (Cobalamin receptor) (Outer membrane cobalamin translocator) BtuB-like n=1 Tax=Herminiimonas arsenicoxydans TaxID=204773 RepID=A4G3Q7_HERAR|nr:putative vitamin B12 transporter btuB precursor (Cobalamin receptor) (Outer membrane cobalamin translocator) BtuB-like [Herminiimonas arsenicoxydans]